MTKINQHIEIVSSSKSHLSSMSRASRQATLVVLRNHYSSVGISLVDTPAQLDELVKLKPDLVFLGMKFVPIHPDGGINDSVKIWLSDYLAARGIACTGSDSEAHQLELNKQLAKQRIHEAGLRTAPFQVLAKGRADAVLDATLTYPLFVKPINRGGGLGIDEDSVVYNPAELRQKAHVIARTYQSDSLVEEFLPGREFSVAILKRARGEDYDIMPIELIAECNERGVRMLAGNVKSANNEKILAVSDLSLHASLSHLAFDAFQALGARDYGRIDIRLDRHGRPTFLEANLIPSLIDGYGSFPKSCALNNQLRYETMMTHIVELGMARRARALGLPAPVVTDATTLSLSVA